MLSLMKVLKSNRGPYLISFLSYVPSARCDGVRVRFAPSPTGHLHLGGLRTALINYLFARRNDGQFVLRIEDTDKSRAIKDADRSIEESLAWAGITPDESPIVSGNYGPYRQSERNHLYSEHIEHILENGSAYACFCSELRLDLLRKDAVRRRETVRYDNRCRSLPVEEMKARISGGEPHTIRLKLLSGPITFADMVNGDITIDLSLIEGDPILVKSDGWPTYHFANVIDDHLMSISHVVRGVEWQTSTPKHLMLYQAFNWAPPVFGHLPLIINADKTKLSKRQNHLSIEAIRDQGFFPEALLSYVLTLGGGFGEDTGDEINTLNSFISNIDFTKLKSSPSVFDMERLQRFNRLAIKRRLEDPHLKEALVEKLKSRVGAISDLEEGCKSEDYLMKVINAYADRIFTIEELLSASCQYLWRRPQLTWEPQKLGFTQVTKSIDDIACIFRESFASGLDISILMSDLRRYAEDQSVSFGKLMKAIRLCLTNNSSGLPVGELISLLGPERTFMYLKAAQEHACNGK